MTDYTTVDKVKEFQGIEGSADDALIEYLITAVSRAFDMATGYTFGAAADSDRVFYVWQNDTDGACLIFDQPYASITSIENGDGVTLATTDYLLKPKDVPYTSATITPLSSVYWTDGDAYDGITVTGLVGYPLTDDIKQAVIQWVSFMYRQKDNPLVDITAIESGAVIATPNRPRYVTDVINLYKDIRPSG